MVKPLRRRQTKGAANRYAQPNATAPHSYSTHSGRPESTYCGPCGSSTWTPQLDEEADLQRTRRLRPKRALTRLSPNGIQFVMR